MEVILLMMIFIGLLWPSHGHEFNIKKFGAKGDGKSDDCKAFNDAWMEACKSPGPATLLVPKGEYLVGPVKIQGPCQGPVTIKAEGVTFIAPEDPKLFKSQNSWFQFMGVNALSILGGTFDGKGQMAWKLNDCAKTGKCGSIPINLSFTKITNSYLCGVTSVDSKQFHMNILNCNNVTLENTKISAPEHSLNTDGIHIGRSCGINITVADIKTGDDCVSLGDGSQQIHVEKVTCGPPGHGIAIGSLGRYPKEEPVIGITVKNCTMCDTMNGVRVKTWPGSPSDGIAKDLSFEDIIVKNVGTPILIDQEYCPYGHCNAKIPSKVKISNVCFKNIKGSSSSELAVKLVCSKGCPCDNIEVADIDLTYKGKNGTESKSECGNCKPKFTGKQCPKACEKMVP